jgi:hypothetical protein
MPAMVTEVRVVARWPRKLGRKPTSHPATPAEAQNGDAHLGFSWTGGLLATVRD